MKTPFLAHIDLQKIRWVAIRCGYAVAIHGSCKRDIDLVAIPWAIEAMDPKDVAEKICMAVDGFFENDKPDKPNPKQMNHGRMAWTILLPGKPTYIDLSVMPPVKP